jgi:hypothetical protein
MSTQNRTYFALISASRRAPKPGRAGWISKQIPLPELLGIQFPEQRFESPSRVQFTKALKIRRPHNQFGKG